MAIRQQIGFLFWLILLGGNTFALAQNKVQIQSGFFEKKPEYPNAIIYTKDSKGQVYMVHEGIKLWCDQALVYYDSNFVKAYGNVKINQGDTIVLTSTYGDYNGDTRFAKATGNVVLTEPASTLKTESLFFDRNEQWAYYNSGGVVQDTSSTLTSKIGKYYTHQKKYEFADSVVIKSDTYTVYAPQIDFYPENGHAYLFGDSKIISETSTVYCKKGFYDTRNNTGDFVQEARIDYDNKIIIGDSIHFKQDSQFASATNNIKVIDTINKSTLTGHYAEIYKAKDSMFITSRALVATLHENDSMYVHADSIKVTGKEKQRIIKAYYKARFFKQGDSLNNTMSGKSDSLFVDEQTGITKLLGTPVLWNGASQMTGDTIHLLKNLLTDKLDSLKVFKNAFLIQKEKTGYNQMKGETLIGLFTNNEIDTVYIHKHAQALYYSRDDKDNLTGINLTLASSIALYIQARSLQGIRFFKQVPGKVYPESKFLEEDKQLDGFNWRGAERIYQITDLFKGKPPPKLPTIKGLQAPPKKWLTLPNSSVEKKAVPSKSKQKKPKPNAK